MKLDIAIYASIGLSLILWVYFMLVDSSLMACGLYVGSIVTTGGLICLQRRVEDRKREERREADRERRRKELFK